MSKTEIAASAKNVFSSMMRIRNLESLLNEFPGNFETDPILRTVHSEVVANERTRLRKLIDRLHEQWIKEQEHVLSDSQPEPGLQGCAQVIPMAMQMTEKKQRREDSLQALRYCAAVAIAAICGFILGVITTIEQGW